jgi:hypothetical protein
MQQSLRYAVLLLVFRSAKVGRRPNLTSFCERRRVSVRALQRAFDELESRGLLSFGPEGESLTLQGLALGAALSKLASQKHRPLAACRSLAA